MRYSSGSLTIWSIALILLSQVEIGSCTSNGDGCLINDRGMAADIQASRNYQQQQAVPTGAVEGQQRFKHKKWTKIKKIGICDDDDDDDDDGSGSGSDSDSDNDNHSACRHSSCTNINVSVSLIAGCSGNNGGNNGGYGVYPTGLAYQVPPPPPPAPLGAQYGGKNPAYQSQPQPPPPPPAAYQGRALPGYSQTLPPPTPSQDTYQRQPPQPPPPPPLQPQAQEPYHSQQSPPPAPPPLGITYPQETCTINSGSKTQAAKTSASHQAYGAPAAAAAGAPAGAPTAPPKPARPTYTSKGSSSSNSAWNVDDYLSTGGISQPNEAAPSSTSAHRPEVGESTSTESTASTGAEETSEAYDDSSSAQPVDINDEYNKQGWRLMRPTKTAGLPSLLDHTPQAPPPMAVPAAVAAGAAKRRRLHPLLEPLTPGGVDMYAAAEERSVAGISSNIAAAKIDEDVWRLVESLSVDEKIGQMTQIHVGMLLDAHTGDVNMTAVQYWVDRQKIGSVIDTPANSDRAQYPLYSPQRLANITNAVQQVAVARGSRVPLVWAMDAARGASYIKHAAMFPAPLAVAASFQPQCAYVAGRVAAKDLRAAGYQWALGPSADIAVEKKAADMALSFGEDPTLAAAMVTSSVRGYQGDYRRDRMRAAVCVRGFIGADQQPGAHVAQRALSDRQLFEYHLPAFEAAVAVGGAASLMQAPGALDGEALGMSPFYSRNVLRSTLRFRGVMLAGQALHKQAHDLHAAANAADAVFLALNNTSVDVALEDDANGARGSDAMELVRGGSLHEDRITESVARIVQMKKDLGLFDKPYSDPSLIEIVGARQDIDDARNVVRESLTLLKNQNAVLPLAPTERVLFVGPHFNSSALLAGRLGAHAQSLADRDGDRVYDGFGDTIMAGVRKVVGDENMANIAFRQGFRLDSPTVRAEDFGQIVRLARKSDKIVVALGEHAGATTGDLHELALDAHQINFVKQLSIAVNRPIAVVLVEARPRLLKEVADIADSILLAYLPGIHGGVPIAETLYGFTNPSGRLPLTYPRYESQARDTVWQGINSEYSPQWPFGHGLGYSKTLFSNVTADSTELAPGKPVTLRVTVQNQGSRDQWETVMLYTTQAFRTAYEPEMLRLRRFDKVLVKQGTAAEVAFTLTAEELAYHTRTLDKVIDSSIVNVTVNAFSSNQRSISIRLLSAATTSGADNVFVR
ncbi:hypothetical protein GGI23_000151 [Coemansia sp. RSA 2559]|nr:hypothetical protein GGI23_000151 [Coemansia sp. RSA 2559]